MQNCKKSISSLVSISLMTMLLSVTSLYSYADSTHTSKNIQNIKSILHSEKNLNSSSTTIADSGMVYLQNTANDTSITNEQVNFYSGANCSTDGSLLGTSLITSGGFNFISGNRYYQDANGLYFLASSSAINVSNIQSIDIEISGTDGNSLRYCIANVICSSTTNACTQQGDSDFGEENTNWSFGF